VNECPSQHMLMGFVSEPINPGGVACYGYVIYRDGVKLDEGYGVVDHPNPSNNVAEYAACIKRHQKDIFQ